MKTTIMKAALGVGVGMAAGCVGTTAKRDGGGVALRESAETLMREVPMARCTVNESGYLTSFWPALPPMPGVQEPPDDVALEYLEFTADGRLAGWKACEPE